MIFLLYLVPLIGLATLAFAVYKAKWVEDQDAGDATMREIAGNIHEGALAFLKAEYTRLAIFVAVVAVLLTVFYAFAGEGTSFLIGLSFIVGAGFSGLAGYFGMQVATKANVRTANAARTSLSGALDVAFSGGLVMGLTVVGLGILGLSVLYILYDVLFVEGINAEAGVTAQMYEEGTKKVIATLSGFSLGASSIALFARVGGGIYTKAADVGADLAGKVYAGIPEDDPRNPATIADNVGDNVGDVAGMGADLFESYVGSIIGTMLLGAGAAVMLDRIGAHPLSLVLLPLILAAVGALVAIGGSFLVKTKEGQNPQKALNLGEFGAAGVMLVLSFGIIALMVPWSYDYEVAGRLVEREGPTAPFVFLAVAIGLIAGVLIGLITEYYCSTERKPTLEIARQSTTGAATNIISGLAVGMKSTGLPIIVLALAIMGAAWAAGLYGIAIAAVGLLSVLGIQLAVDAYGPISDNAGGIAEMSGLPPEVRERTDLLDAVGNTTAAIGKGFAIGSAALTALALFAAYLQVVNLNAPLGERVILNISNPTVMAGLFIGAMLPYVFSAMAMDAVGRAARDMIDEVGRQFNEIDGLREGREGVKAEYAKCVEISTKASLREMIWPGVLAVTAPVVVGIISPTMLGGLLAGVTVSGVLMALFQANAGGAWDNAKKRIEQGVTLPDGTVLKKGDEAHKAAVVGDTVGDPLKDTSGPSINILMKLIAVVALVIAPLIAPSADDDDADDAAPVAANVVSE